MGWNFFHRHSIINRETISLFFRFPFIFLVWQVEMLLYSVIFLRWVCFSLPVPPISAGIHTFILHLYLLSVSCIHWQPNLYTLVVILKDASGHVIDCESSQVGIRQISKAPKQLLVNGHPVMIRGVNRHEHHPRIGKTNMEPCMIKVTPHFVFVSHTCSLNGTACLLLAIIPLTYENVVILLFVGSDSNEAIQYQCC